MATLGDCTSRRVSPSGASSTPPLKKKVTCGYFSVSAVRKLLSPCAASTSARMSSIGCGGKAAESGNASSYCVMVTTSTSGRPGPRSKASKAGSASARVICRARSERKLKKITPSPPRTGPTGFPSASTTTRGFTNSSVSPAW